MLHDLTIRTRSCRATWIRHTLAILAAAVLAIVFAVVPAAAERVALVIGNSNYQAAASLANPLRDAAAIGDRLEETGFRVTRVIDADLVGMRSALAAFGDEAAGAEIAVIFYAGHGMQADGENYLVPVDARIAGRSDLDSSSLRASEIFAHLLEAGPEVVLLILDACRDNPFTSATGTSQGLATGSFSASAFVQRPNSAGMIIGFAAAPGAVAFDGADGNSPYTTALLQWIDRPGLELGTMLRRVRGTVMDLTDGAQVPWVEEALLREVYLRPAAPGSPAPADAPERLQVALLETIGAMPSVHEQEAARAFFERLVGPEAAERLTPASDAVPDRMTQDEDLLRAGLIWLSIRGSDDVAILQSFVDTFPGSPFVDLARERIDRLHSTPVPVAAAVPAAPEVSVAPSVMAQPPAAQPNPPAPLPGAAGLPPELAEPPQADDSVRVDGPPQQAATMVPGAAHVAEAPPADLAGIEATVGLARDGMAAVQVLLAQGGDYTGPIDGLIGRGSRLSLAAFQKGAGLAVTGHIDLPTLRTLVVTRARAALRAERDGDRRLSIHRIAAHASVGAAADPTVLRVAALSRNDDVHAYWDEMARSFEDDHPGTLVRISHQSDWMYKENILGMLGSDTPPDLIHTWGGGHLEALRDAGFVRDLTDEMAAGWALEFRPGALGNLTSDGAIHGAPTFMALVSLWVNEPLLAQAGIPLEQLETWDGFLRAARQLRARGIVPIAVGGRDAWPFQMIWGNIALSLGGRDAFEAAYAGEGLGFRDPVFVEASARMQALGAISPFQPGFLEMDEAAAGNAVARGEAALVITGNWRLHSMGWNWPGGHAAMERELRRVDFPGVSASAGPAGTYGGVDGYAVTSGAPDIAVDLLRRLTSLEVQSSIAEISTAIPSAAGADLTVKDPLIADVAGTLLTSGYHQLYYDQALGPVAGEVVNNVALRLATGRIDPATATSEIDRAWRNVLRDRGATGEPKTRP